MLNDSTEYGGVLAKLDQLGRSKALGAIPIPLSLLQRVLEEGAHPDTWLRERLESVVAMNEAAHGKNAQMAQFRDLLLREFPDHAKHIRQSAPAATQDEIIDLL